MSYKPVRRKPVKKFVSWKFSEERLERIKRVAQGKGATERHHSIYQDKKLHELIFQGAERFFNEKFPKNARFLFVGQGMRPLFEAVRGLNEIEQTFLRKSLRYIVSPRKLDSSDSSLKEKFCQELLRRKLIPKGRKTFYIVDVTTDKKQTFKAICNAIKSINPEAVVELISQNHSVNFGVNYSESLQRPTFREGRKIFRSLDEYADSYLWFQKALQDYLKKKYQKK